MVITVRPACLKLGCYGLWNKIRILWPEKKNLNIKIFCPLPPLPTSPRALLICILHWPKLFHPWQYLLNHKEQHSPSSNKCVCMPLWMVARQAPLSMGFSRQEYWSGLRLLHGQLLKNSIPSWSCKRSQGPPVWQLGLDYVNCQEYIIWCIAICLKKLI